MTRKKCLGRTPGNVLTSYACSRYAQTGKDWCYWHDPETENARLEQARRAREDRRLERQYRLRRDE